MIDIYEPMQSKVSKHLFTDDFVLTDTYWDTVKRQEFDPERHLMLAVLKDAILDYKKYRYTQNRRFRDAQKWLFEGNADHVFSFGHICSVFDFSAQKIRKALLGGTSTLDLWASTNTVKPSSEN